MLFTSKDIACKLQEYPSLVRIKRQLEFEMEQLAGSNSDPASRKYCDELIALLLPVSAELRRM